MKKTIAWILVLIFALSLSACTAQRGNPAPEATPELIPTETEAPTPAPTVEPTAEPTAEPAGEDDNAIEILTGIYDRYYPGTAGCSLTAAKFAGQLLDWYAAAGSAEAARGSAANFAAAHDMAAEAVTADGIPIDFPQKLGDIFSVGMRLGFGQDLGLLSDAGYERVSEDWTGAAAGELFRALYEGCGIAWPLTVTVYYSDDNAERFLSAEFPTYEIDEYAAFGGLKTVGAIPADTELLSFTQDGKSLKLDLSAPFAQYAGSMGTSGEYMVLGAVVNTFLNAFDAEEITITVDGKWLETGHNIYDYALTTYADNVGV